MKKDWIRKSAKRYQTIEKNNHMKFLLIFLALFLLSIMAAGGCGLFYQYGSEHDYSQLDTSGLKDKLFTVSEVVDGDTLTLSNGDRIRLLGINTPEMGMYFYLEAKEVLEIMLLGKEVVLEEDVSDRDMYGRKLRYVFQEGLFVNLEMLNRGFANIYTCPPDVRYAEDFLAAERYARENNLGLWELSDISAVRIEVHYDAPGNDNENINGEHVILENTGEEILDTVDWTIKDSGTNIYTFDSYDFHPGTRIVLFSGKGKDGEGSLYWNSRRPVWNNDFDTLYLRDKQGLLMGLYNY